MKQMWSINGQPARIQGTGQVRLEGVEEGGRGEGCVLLKETGNKLELRPKTRVNQLTQGVS